MSRQLTVWGDSRDMDARPRTVRLERDLERVLEDLADEFPLLRSLVDHRAGGQKRLPLPGRGPESSPGPLFASVSAAADAREDQNGLDGSATKGEVSGGEGEPTRPSAPPTPPESSRTGDRARARIDHRRQSVKSRPSRAAAGRRGMG